MLRCTFLSKTKMHSAIRNAACAVANFKPTTSLSHLNSWMRGISGFLCWERWGLEDYTSDWNVKQLLQLPITSVRTLPETMQLVSKAERQTHPWEAWLDNKEASLKVKTGKLRFFFLKSFFTVIWLAEGGGPQPNSSLKSPLSGKWNHFR